MDLNLNDDIVDLTAALVDIPSVSRNEATIADAIEAALSGLSHLEVIRHGNTIVARTHLGRSERVVIAGHIDTVPEADNLPSSRVVVDGEERLVGLGSCDMKGGVAVALKAAASVIEPVRDVSYIFYEAEEIEDTFNGLRILVQERPELVKADFAVLMEPSDAGIEAGCQGTLRAQIRTTGVRAHSARSWKGQNAIHAAAGILNTLAEYRPQRVMVDGLEYREGLNAVGIAGGIAGNVIPDECVVTVNYRFAPSTSAEVAKSCIEAIFRDYEVSFIDANPGAMPGLSHPAARAFLEVVGGEPRPKFGWTDVSRFSALNVPAVNFGPGDPSLAHTREEYVPVEQLRSVEKVMLAWLQGS